MRLIKKHRNDPRKKGAVFVPGKSFTERLIEGLQFIVKILLQIKGDAASGARISLLSCFRAWRYGFSRWAYLIYELGSNDPKAYLSEYIHEPRRFRISRSYSFILNNKLSFGQLMEQHGIPHPLIYALLNRGSAYLIESSTFQEARKWLETKLNQGKRLVLKPVLGSQGKGLFFLDQRGRTYILNGVEIGPSDLCSLVERLEDYIVTEYADQAAYAQLLYPDTTNTIRLLTLWDYHCGEPFVAAAAHRIGTSRSFPVDNWLMGRGGLSAHIDLETGQLGAGATVYNGKQVLWHDLHPETKAQIEGVQVPSWSDLKQQIVATARLFPYVPEIGWDGVITEQGWCILEANVVPGMYVLQVHGPLLNNPRVKRFYRAHGVL